MSRKKEEPVIEPNIQEVGTLISKLDHPVYLSYMGEGFTLPPRGIQKNVAKNKLGALPKGVVFSPTSN